MTRLETLLPVLLVAAAVWLFLRGLGSALAWVARMQDRREKAHGR